MSVVSIQQAQNELASLIHQVSAGDEVIITENDRPVARLVPAGAPPPRKPRQPGTLRGSVLYMAPDFDAPLSDFQEYME